ncbi:carbohydrate ABC transporter permease [Dactylosporangium sp. AC04546]|uniref:carbohydrate ABC transporter permease n=1 Tax=Dactylosporangium sp. AC04546 TaxID=2862460 RepID=UPI001EDD3062|nr:carbohydrate ABC transporter permease [Dactylosporangium sp. AC04546]WVK80544.1 carbohydrate ABC transporter permease [Dactylosporangium sp. AC04546]
MTTTLASSSVNAPGPLVSPGPAARTTGKRRLPRQLLFTSVLFVFGVYFLAPVLWLAIASTKDTGDLYGTFGFWFGRRFALGSQLADLFTNDDSIYLRWLANSALYSLVGAAVATLLAGACGYAMAKYEFRGRELAFSVVLGGVLVPGTALAIPLYLLLSEVGMANTYWSVLLPSMVSPFGVYLSRIYAAASVPDELLASARVDGASELRTFVSIALRLMSPGLVTVFLFQFVAIWNNFLLPLVMLSDEHTYPVTLGLYTWNSQVTHYPEYFSLTIIGSLVSVIPLVIAFLMLQRFWRNDLGAGAVK